MTSDSYPTGRRLPSGAQRAARLPAPGPPTDGPAASGGQPTTPTTSAAPAQHDGQADSPGLAWSWEIDLAELVEALSDAPPAASGPANAVPAADASQGDGQDDAAGQDETAGQAEPETALAGRGRELGAGEVAGRIAERLIPGPGLAALLGAVPAPALADHDLPAVAAGFRRIASWATAAELSRRGADRLPVRCPGR